MKILKNQVGPGLLSQFIMHKVENYIEPQRRGTPKGEPIGLSKTKYWASLLMLTNVNRKKMTKDVGVSYGLLRKWNTEETFKKMVLDHCHDFAALFNEHIKERVRRRQEKFEEHLKKPIEEIAQSDPITLDYEEYSDAGGYSDLLLSMIFEVFDINLKHTTSEDATNLEIKLEWSLFLDVLRHFSGIPKRKDIAKMEERIERDFLISTLNSTKIALLQPSIAEEERKGLVFLLNSMEKLLELKQKKEESREEKKD